MTEAPALKRSRLSFSYQRRLFTAFEILRLQSIFGLSPAVAPPIPSRAEGRKSLHWLETSRPGERKRERGNTNRARESEKAF